MNVVIAGHVDHGKSTLIGRLLYDSESVAQDRVAEIQKIVEEYKKKFEFAYFLDALQEELEEERTIDTTGVIFKSVKHCYTIVDVPGHKEFIKNMLTGASQADAAILVVSAAEAVQEQTRRHAFLLNLLGIKKLLVAVNKMDLVGYKEDVFQVVKGEMERLLSSLGYSDVKFIPTVAIDGDNIYKPSQRIKWYQGPTLIQALDEVMFIDDTKPSRFIVQDTYQVGSEKITVGKVASGVFREGDEVVFEPSSLKGRIKEIRVFEGRLRETGKGDCVGIVAVFQPPRGDVGGLITSPPKPSRGFLGEVVLLSGTLKKGERLKLRCGTKKVNCEVKELKERINSESGEIMERDPMEIYENEAAIAFFATEPLVVEKFSDIPELGRFTLARDKDIGAGIVLEVNP